MGKYLGKMFLMGIRQLFEAAQYLETTPQKVGCGGKPMMWPLAMFSYHMAVKLHGFPIYCMSLLHLRYIQHMHILQ